MHRLTLFFFVLLCTAGTLAAQDWSGRPVPATPPPGTRWQLDAAHSDDFNYNGKNATFTSKWKDTYFNGWTGPGLTHWTRGSSSISNGKLVIGASRRSGTNKVNCGVVTSKTKVKYPIYMEARIKASNLELSSNFWMLSPDDEREIDVLEVYGGARQVWFARNASTNFHVFLRGNNNQIISDFNDQTHHTLPGNAFWRSDYHTFGVYWKSPSEVFFYIDGKQTADGSWGQARMLDKDYTGAVMNKNRYTMDREVFMIIDTEDHAWRSNQGIVATDADLRDGSKNKMYVDWVRTYKPVATGGGGGGGGGGCRPPIGQTIWLKANNGAAGYVACEKNITNGPLRANRPRVRGWEQFTVESAGPNNQIALRAKANNRYVSAMRNQTAVPLLARQTYIGGWEKFTWECRGNGKVALKAVTNGRYVQARLNLGDKALGAIATTVQGWETFNWGTGTPGAERGDEPAAGLDALGSNTSAADGGQVSTYPNPVNDRLFLRNAEGYDRATLYNQLGQRVLQERLQGRNALGTELLEDGMYLLELTGEDGARTVRKVMVRH